MDFSDDVMQNWKVLSLRFYIRATKFSNSRTNGISFRSINESTILELIIDTTSLHYYSSHFVNNFLNALDLKRMTA